MFTVSALRQFAAYTAIILSLLPMALKNVTLVVSLGHEGFDSGLGWPGDMYALIIEGIVYGMISAGFLCLSRWLLGYWPRTVLIILGTLLAVEIIQDITMVVTVFNLDECGYPICFTVDG